MLKQLVMYSKVRVRAKVRVRVRVAREG